MKRCVIAGAAPVADYQRISSFLTEDDFIIACDGGLFHLEKLKITPDLIIGDFDSHPAPETDIETITLPVEKDDTDCFYAAKEGIKRGFTDFLFVGVTGARLDHSLVNLSILKYLQQNGCHGIIVDDYSKMQLVEKETVTIDGSCSYFSTIAFGGEAAGINIKNARWELNDGRITPDFQYGISNKPVIGSPCNVNCQKGTLLLIEVK